MIAVHVLPSEITDSALTDASAMTASVIRESIDLVLPDDDDVSLFVSDPTVQLGSTRGRAPGRRDDRDSIVMSERQRGQDWLARDPHELGAIRAQMRQAGLL